MDKLLLNKLVDILAKENAIYEEILEISKTKTKIIIDGKVSELENMIKLEQALILQIGKFESMREEHMEKYAAEIGIAVEELNISDIIKKFENIEDADVNSLKTSRENILCTLEQLKTANDLNAELIKSSLEYIDFSINLLSSADSAGSNYSISGRVNSSKKRSYLDMKL